VAAKSHRALLIALVLLTVQAVGDAVAQDAFPGAEGPGRHAAGGRGGRVLAVTNLADDGPGSLRAAVDASGPRTVIFRVDGTIRLSRPLVVRHGRITIAGQSAPGDGVTLRDQPLIIAADDVVVRYMRSRLGDESGVEADAVSIDSGRHIVLDHLSASWSIDETLSVASRYEPPDKGPYDVTVQWCLIAESLDRSRHAKGAHGYGTLVRGAYGARIGFHHNLWAHHRARGPRPGNYHPESVDPVGPLVEFRSNVFYNWGGAFSGYDADKAQHITYSFVDNAYVRGPQSTGSLAFSEENALARAFFAGNTMDGVLPADPWSLVAGGDARGYRLTTAPQIGVVAREDAASSFSRVLDGAGASLRRDGADARVVQSVRERNGRHIDSQGDVGGWPALRQGVAPPDGDGDGMPDAWERRHGLDSATSRDGGADRDGDGYTNLEEYLNELVTAPASRHPPG
jgi:hypothetical protein